MYYTNIHTTLISFHPSNTKHYSDSDFMPYNQREAQGGGEMKKKKEKEEERVEKKNWGSVWVMAGNRM